MTRNRNSMSLSSLGFPSINNAPSALVGNLRAPLDVSCLVNDEMDNDMELEEERLLGFEGVSDDSLTTGIVLELMR